MTNQTPDSTDVVEKIRDLMSTLALRDVTLTKDDVAMLECLVGKVVSAEAARDNIAAWLRARAEIAVNREDDPEQPGHAEFSKGWRSGAYNNLHLAANAVEDGKAKLPRERWPAYLRGEKIAPPKRTEKQHAPPCIAE